MTSKDLEERLIGFAVNIIRLSDGIITTFAGKTMSSQIVRSGSSNALNYGEAQSAESAKDFVYKLGICLKELRETYINLRIIAGAELHLDRKIVNSLLIENNELISIFVKSIETSKKKQNTANLPANP